jgi:hypothetical protein
LLTQIGNIGIPLVLLEHSWLPLVSLAPYWLPLGSPVVNTDWEHWNTTGTTGIPLETPLGDLLNANEVDMKLVTTGMPLEIPLGKLMKCNFDLRHLAPVVTSVDPVQ